MLEIETIIEKLSLNKFIIYGAGGHADKFLKAIKEMNLGENYLGSAVTEMKKGCTVCKKIDEIDRDILIVIAAHHKNAEEMQQNLKKLGFSNYISIYPYMTEICFGKPYKLNEVINVNEFLQECKYSNVLAIYYLAVECADGKNTYGKDLYCRMMNISSEEQTTQKRWNELVLRTENYKRNNEVEKYAIKINDKQKYILDGFHRVALAKYFRIQEIQADFFDVDIETYNAATFRCKWDDNDLRLLYSDTEIDNIHRIREKVFCQKDD